MSKIQCMIKVTSKDWRYVYSNVLNFFNEEIQSAYSKANEFYLDNKDKSFLESQLAFDSFVKDNNITGYWLYYIKTSLFSGTNNKLYKPKKSNFKRLNNRSKMLSTEDLSVSFDKDNHSMSFITSNFDDLDLFISTNPFISEFITMVNTINWPTRPGPKKTIKGCVMALVTGDKGDVFYKAGPNPPVINESYTDSTLNEPTILKSEMIRNIKLIKPTTQEETSQPTPDISNIDLSEF